ncbi:pentatricopeptide repeat domain-containing protein 3, mitochondrial [Cheilinus undulatus]|uniref:pentatricopeptide repeat domain-containing protein 3, mitochondrial n=1 Tax=Cheilinus undulatus TaxID=241271 RepID=UPI001BD525A2|nr:pentatricopeptide repeat domain-containing protein 3, mitochondrial [Cheilinus undulatus]
MAAPCRHVGRILLRKGGFLPRNSAQLKVNRTFTQTSPLRQPAAETIPESTETIVIPQRKTWGKEAVLEALAATVSRDPTAYPHQFQDDPYLSPKTSTESKLFTLSLESGRSAAKYFIDSNPRFFSEDFAEPHVPCLMPASVSPLLDEVSEEALKERISLRRVKAAVDMYDQLLQAGASVSIEATHDLLDLVCLYCDRDPAEEPEPEPEPEPEDMEGAEVVKRTRSRARRASDLLTSEWKENNNAERIFNLLPERDTRCYSALIRGMVKHGAYAKAFSSYTDLLNDRLTADVHIFNALISAAPEVRDKYNEKWEVITELLKQMNQQKVQPTLLTFNSVLKALKRCGSLARAQSLHTLNEMKALRIAPSLASFDHILAIFFKGASRQANIELFQEVMSELAGSSFTCQDPDDAFFFMNSMRICLDIKDMELAYKVQSLLEVGDNWRFLANPFSQTLYYGRFFSLLCMMEHIDVVMKWYRRLVPSLYYPSIQGLRDLLQALDTDSRLDLLPSIWKDIRSLGHDNKSELVEELLALMARDHHSPEVQDSFAACALDVKGVFENRGRSGLEWTPSSLSHVTSLLLRANRTQQAWEMLQLFKSNNRVPAEGLFEEFLSLCHSEGSSQRAVELVQLSAAFCLSVTPDLARRTLAEFELTEEQRAVLSELESAGESSE